MMDDAGAGPGGNLTGAVDAAAVAARPWGLLAPGWPGLVVHDLVAAALWAGVGLLVVRRAVAHTRHGRRADII